MKLNTLRLVPPASMDFTNSWMLVEAKERLTHPGLPPSRKILWFGIHRWMAGLLAILIPVIGREKRQMPVDVDTKNPLKVPKDG
jgi:hypothetical protein